MYEKLYMSKMDQDTLNKSTLKYINPYHCRNTNHKPLSAGNYKDLLGVVVISDFQAINKYSLIHPSAPILRFFQIKCISQAEAVV